MIREILENACNKVHKNTKNLVGNSQGSEVMGKGAGGDNSRRIDIIAESTVLEVLKEHNFHPNIVGEECGSIEGEKGYLIMDAIDGTLNSIRGLPFFCCSLAYASDYNLKSVSEAAIIDLTNGDLYSASKSNGAYLNGKPITKSNRETDLMVGINISGMNLMKFKLLERVLDKANHIRHLGANALELCFLARGYLDAYIDIRDKIRATDMAAAYLIVHETGGKIFDLSGKILDSPLAVDARMSFIAIGDDKKMQIINDIIPNQYEK